MKKRMFIYLILFSVLLSMCGCSKKEVTAAEIEQSTEATTTPSKKETFPIVRVCGVFEFTLYNMYSVTNGAKPYNRAYNGNVYEVMLFDVRNLTDYTQFISFEFWYAIVDGEKIIPNKYPEDITNTTEIFSEITHRDYLRGAVVFEIPSEWKVMTIYLTDRINAEEYVTITIYHEDL